MVEKGELKIKFKIDHGSSTSNSQKIQHSPQITSNSSSSSYSTEFSLNDFSNILTLKIDHNNRPLWITPLLVAPNGQHFCYIFLETFSSYYKLAYDFLITIAEPVCRPSCIHEYKITQNSVQAAASIGLRTEDIISGLQRLSKCILTHEVENFIAQHTMQCGKIKIVLKNNRYFIESISSSTLNLILQNKQINSSRIDHLKSSQEIKLDETQYGLLKYSTTLFNFSTILERDKEYLSGYGLSRDESTGFLVETSSLLLDLHLPGTTENKKIDERQAMGLTFDNTQSNSQNIHRVFSFEINPTHIENVLQTCHDIQFPVLQEYDFRRDNLHHDIHLPITLKASTMIRDYQEKSLSKMFGNGRARSGIIVLPCGSGKTLVGIVAASTIKRSVLVLCTTNMAVDQWRAQIQHWCHLPEKYIIKLVSGTNVVVPNHACIIISTYSMLSYTGRRSSSMDLVIEQITKREWGLLILDEVHVAPAHVFRQCVSITHSRCKLGLTATLIREDNLVDELYWLIGPKLYEANWLDLQKAGHIATVMCIEVWCPLSPIFFEKYLQEDGKRNFHLQQLLYVMNPNKFRHCEYLIKLHEQRGDKIIVFSDSIFALEQYGHLLKKPFIYGKTDHDERLAYLNQFKRMNSNVNCLFLSKVGDNSLDLPDVNVIIQISFHSSSRQQEAQRFGRILRPKPLSNSQYNAFFYSLVTPDTREMFFANKRERYLVDQGYYYQVVKEIIQPSTPDLSFSDEESQKALLNQVVNHYAEKRHFEIEQDDTPVNDYEEESDNNTPLRSTTKLSSLSGGYTSIYNTPFPLNSQVNPSFSNQRQSSKRMPTHRDLANSVIDIRRVKHRVSEDIKELKE